MLNTTTDHYQYASQIAPLVAFTDYSDGQHATFNDEIQPHKYVLVDCQLSTEISGVRTQPQTSWFIRRLYGKDLWCASWLDALCEIDERFLLHLCDQKQSYIHYLCLVRLAWQRSHALLSLADQAQILQQRKQKSLLQSLYRPYPVGLLNVLSKFGHVSLCKSYYQLLVELQSNATTRAYLAHETKLRPYHVRWVNDFPFDVLNISVLRSIKKATDYQKFNSMVAVIRYCRGMINMRLSWPQLND